MRLLVTRPLAQAVDAVRELRAQGVDAHALPLIGIEPLPDASEETGGDRAGETAGTASDSIAVMAAELRSSRATLAGRRLVMFVSANAVRHFLAAPGGVAWPPGTLAGSTGPGTTAALRAAGVPAACIREPGPQAERLDSEALWQQLRHLDWQGASVLVVRGERGRDWLADTLRAEGARVDFVAAYRRTLPRLDEAQAALLRAAQADARGHAWHFSSSEAVHNLPRLAPGGAWRASPALATHPRIGEAARAAGFTHVQVLAPGLAALRQAWQALQAGEGRQSASGPPPGPPSASQAGPPSTSPSGPRSGSAKVRR